MIWSAGKVIGITAKKVADGIAYSIPIGDAVKSIRNAFYGTNQHGVNKVARRTSTAKDGDDTTKMTANLDSCQQVRSLLPQMLPEKVPVMISGRW
jgi:DNA-binding NtrC family response regulator